MADTTPTLAGFEAYCRTPVGIPTSAMPVNDPGFAIWFAIALEWVPLGLNCIGQTTYTYTVYNWGVSVLLQFQQDQANQTFFADKRAAFGVYNLVPGAVSATADEATSTTLTLGKAMSNLSLEDLQRVKDPYGRQAIAVLMEFGPLWGLS
jgi:hypothetical protein